MIKNDFEFPLLPCLIFDAGSAYLLTIEGEVETYDPMDPRLQRCLEKTAFYCVGKTFLEKKYGLEFLAGGLDLLELFYWLNPLQKIPPSIHGLLELLNESFSSPEERLTGIFLLLGEAKSRFPAQRTSNKIAVLNLLDHAEWNWAPLLMDALNNHPTQHTSPRECVKGLYKNLENWEAVPCEHDALEITITQEDALNHLKDFLHAKKNAEIRDSQNIYTAFVSKIFTSKTPRLHFAQAGTGTGKTLGYLASADLWAKKNKKPVWISTYTKNLQNQILDAFKPLKNQSKIMLRKGRENYLCLLNAEEMASSNSFTASSLQAFAFILHWISHTATGDLNNGEIPTWLIDLLGWGSYNALSDKRGECIYAACPHYQKCFVESNIERAKHADLIIANHSLTLHQMTFSQNENEGSLPSHYIFDEAHHLFNAATSFFEVSLTGANMSEMKRWIHGNELEVSFQIKTRQKSLARKLEMFLEIDKGLQDDLRDLLKSSKTLPHENWLELIKRQNEACNDSERFLKALLNCLQSQDGFGHYSQNQTLDISALPESLKPICHKLFLSFECILQMAEKLSERMKRLLEDDTTNFDKKRLTAIHQTLMRRVISPMQDWKKLLIDIESNQKIDNFKDVISYEAIAGKGKDLGIFRYPIDPIAPLSNLIAKHGKGLLLTSATLADKLGDQASLQDQLHMGSAHFKEHYQTDSLALDSPFDYKIQSKIYLINDLDRNNLSQSGRAYEALFKASKGSAIGIFTAINRLRSMHSFLNSPLTRAGLNLYGQHVDALDPSNLIALFKKDPHAILLGTDAIRDGIDIPGDALRMIIFDKVPWPRPTPLHQARRNSFHSRDYDLYLTRQKLKQAFGRLIRTKQDKGIFILFESNFPSELLKAFPPSTPIEKLSLKETIGKVKEFF